MCLIVFAWKVVQGTPLFAIDNHDDYHDRPLLPAHWWPEASAVFAGKDVDHQGTWLGISKDGRFSAATCVRDGSPAHTQEAISKDTLVSEYLQSTLSPMDYIRQLKQDKRQFEGYNLLVGDKETLIWYSNRYPDDERNGKPLDSGIYGLSNGKLDESWRKVTRAKAQFTSLLYQCAPVEAYFELLKDCTRASECRLPETGLSTEEETVMSSIFVFSPEYGTRSSSVIMIHADRDSVLTERIFPRLETPPYPVIIEAMPNGTCKNRKNHP